MTRGARRIALALLVLILLPGACARAERRRVLYFYENYCEACRPEEEFADTFYALTGERLADCEFTAYNTVRSDGRAALEAAKTEYALERVSLPMVVVDGKAYCGAKEMETSLAETALSWQETKDSEILYLYTPACESCARAAAVLETLPETITVRRGESEFESKIVVRRVDASAEPALAAALFDAYAAPDEKRITPAVFYGDTYLSGADAIERGLPGAVTLGWAAGGVRVEAQARTEEKTVGAVSLMETVGAGIAAGLNTCALSMLLMFLSAVLQAGRRAGVLAACFLTAKFVCYLLIGTVLLGVMQRANPDWLRPLARGLLTALGAAMILLNVRDALAAQRGDYGRIRNQLPGGLRGALQRAVAKATQGRVLAISAAGLGFIVAAGEFLCAGQLYLLRLLDALHSGARGQTANLLAYCAAFIAPSAAVTALVVGGGSSARVSAFFAQRLATVKWITAAATLVLIVTAWLL